MKYDPPETKPQAITILFRDLEELTSMITSRPSRAPLSLLT
jgi:hypothetical protein